MMKSAWVAVMLLLALPVSAQTISAQTIIGKGGEITIRYGSGFDGALGDDRQAIVRQATQVWADRLVINAPLVIEIDFASLTCSNSGAVLGSARPYTYRAGFGGAPRADTWYPSALANQFAGRDINPEAPEILININGDIDQGCFNDYRWRYDLDAPGPQEFALYQTLVHEIAHGLGYSTVLNLADGSVPGGSSNAITGDHYMRHISQNDQSLVAMSADQRRYAVTSDALVWHGLLAQGRARAKSGLAQVNLHAPSELRQGSSLSHISALGANANAEAAPEFLQPSYNEHSTLWLADALLADMGWPMLVANKYLTLRPQQASVGVGEDWRVDLVIQQAQAAYEGLSSVHLSVDGGKLSAASGCEPVSPNGLVCELSDATELLIPLTVRRDTPGRVVLEGALFGNESQARSATTTGQYAVSQFGAFTDTMVAVQAKQPSTKQQKSGALSPWFSLLLLAMLVLTRREVFIQR